MSLSEYFSKLKAKPTPFDVPFEEETAERGPTTAYVADHVGTVELDTSKLTEEDVDRILFYVDGTQKSAVVGWSEATGFPVPIIASHIVAGAGRPVDQGVELEIMRELLVILFPHTAVCEAIGRNIPLPDERILPRLDHRGRFYEKASKPRPSWRNAYGIPMFFCDTSYTFRIGRRPKRPDRVKEHMLAAYGRVRSAAMNAVAGIRRALELGVVWELRQRFPEHLILNDGPLAREMTRIYGKLSVRELRDLDRNPEKCFMLFRRVVGLVKNVSIVPESGLEETFGGKPSTFRIPVFRLRRPIAGEGEPEDREERRAPFGGVVSCFCLLRPELTEAIPLVVSPTGGLVRVDVPIAALISEYDENWMTPDFELGLDERPEVRESLRRILAGVLVERYPYPGTKDLHRMLVELAGTELTERLLRSRLLQKEVIRMALRDFL